MIGDWQQDGWTVVPGFLDGVALEDLRQEANRLLAQSDLFAERGIVANSTRRSDRLDPVIDVSPPFADLARDSRLVALVSNLLGGEVQLLKDKFIAKPPGAPGYSVHQDGAYWPGMRLDTSRFLTAILFLDDATGENGPIECLPGCHQLLTDAETIADPEEALLGALTPVEAAAGDLLLLHAFTPHRSGMNRSQGMRRALMFTYGIDARPNLYADYQQHRASMIQP